MVAREEEYWKWKYKERKEEGKERGSPTLKMRKELDIIYLLRVKSFNKQVF